MPKKVPLSILAGLAGILCLVVPAWVPETRIVLFAAPLPLLVAGLSMGLKAALIAAFSGATFLSFLNIKLGFSYLLLAVIPVGCLTYLSLLNRPTIAPDKSNVTEWYPSGRLLSWLTALTAGLFCLSYIMFLGKDGGMTKVAEDLIRIGLAHNPEIQQNLAAGQAEGVSEDSVIRGMAMMAPPTMAIVFLLTYVVNLLLAFGIVSRAGSSLRPRLHIAQTHLPEWVGLAFLVCLALAILVHNDIGYIGAALATILFTPYFLMGLVVVHVWTAKRTAQPIMLGLFYLLLLAVPPLVLFVGCLGLADQWLNFRKDGSVPAS